MKTEHYLVKHLEDFSRYIEKVDNLKKYLDDIESIFPIIEKIFGREWRDGYITIILNDSQGGASYGRPGGVHTIYIGINNKAIQIKTYPENLWGCLLHETLHAFMNPIIHNKTNGSNYLDGDCDSEPFIRSFQALVYLKLKEKGKLSEALCNKYLKKLEEELKGEARVLYGCYMNMFLKSPLNFSKFIERLESSTVSLFKKHSFWQDLNVAEEALTSAD